MELVWSQLASKNLLEVAQYVEENFGSRVAEKKIDMIIKRMNRQLLFPESGVFDHEYSSEDLGTRDYAYCPKAFLGNL